MNELAWVKEVVDLYFAPWGAAKAARFEVLTGDKPFDPEVVLKLIHEKLAALDTRPCDAKTPGLRERVAIALARQDEYDDWNDLTETTQIHYFGMADAALAALAPGDAGAVEVYTQAEMDEADKEADEIHKALFAPGNAGAVAPGFTSSWQEELSLSETMNRIGNAGAVEKTPGLKAIFDRIEQIAFDIAPVNQFTPQIVQLCIAGRAALSPGNAGAVEANAAEAIQEMVGLIDPHADELDDRDVNKLFDAARRIWAAGYRKPGSSPTPAALDPVRVQAKWRDQAAQLLERADGYLNCGATNYPAEILRECLPLLRALSHPAPGNAGEANIREALDWLINCVECEVNVKGTTSVFQLRLAKAKAALAAPASNPQEG